MNSYYWQQGVRASNSMELQVNYIHLNIFIDCFQNLVVPQNRYLYIYIYHIYWLQYISVNIFAIIYVFSLLQLPPPKKMISFNPPKVKRKSSLQLHPPRCWYFFSPMPWMNSSFPEVTPRLEFTEIEVLGILLTHWCQVVWNGSLEFRFFSLKGSIQRRCNGELGLWFPKRRIHSGIEGFLSRSW